MIIIKTGYFAQAHVYFSAGYELISISKFPPKSFNGLKYFPLSPFKLDYPSLELYVNDFKSKLDSLNASKVVNDLIELSNQKPVVLLCFERPDDFCHRQIVADWLNSEIPDLGVEEFKIKLKPRQVLPPSLF